MKITKDLITYIEHIDSLSSNLSKKDKKQVEVILTVIMKLLIGFKVSSNLGKKYIKFY